MIVGLCVSVPIIAAVSDSQPASIDATKSQVSSTGSTEPNATANALPDLRQAAAQSIHAVVHIKTEFERKNSVWDNFFNDPFFGGFGFSQPRKQYPLTASGSGVIISADGYIVTNNHVVEGANRVTVTLNDKHEYSAEIIGRDPKTDLALIKIDATQLPFLTFGNSDSVQVGEWVLAIGNPFNLTSTVTAGIVSAKARNLNILGENTAVESFIQTDAAVNSGNSGGALVNTNGELIGINAAIASNTGSYTGYSFAIPGNIAKKIAEDLKEYGEPQTAYIGILISELDNDRAQQLNLKEIKGVLVEEVLTNSAAEDAGLKIGDVLLSFNNTAINSFSEMKEFLLQHRPGDVIVVHFMRNQKEQSIKVTLKNKNGTTAIIQKTETNTIEALGGTFEPLASDAKKRFAINNGILLASVDPNGILYRSGVQEGFIITAVNRVRVNTSQDIANAMKKDANRLLLEGIYPNGNNVMYDIKL